MALLVHRDASSSPTCSVCFSLPPKFIISHKAVCLNNTLLLFSITVYIPSATMIPERRLTTLLHQAREYQHSRCVYHNSPLESSTFSLYTDHHCNKSDFPNVTTTILQGHSDEVWNMQWSHDGVYLATCGKDKTAIIWKTTVRFTNFFFF